MQMVQEISSLVPIIVNRGNHEMHSDSNTVAAMFEDYFELYDLQINNATGVTVGPVFLAIIDPSNMLYPRDFHKFTKESRYSSLEATKSAVQKAREEGKTIVSVTHYPLICSFPNKGHCIANEDYNET
jgi:DNA repair exonuclease SbcCD nuclease subunit